MSDKAAISSAKKTLVEEGTQFKGTMTSTCPVTVNGRIEGELSAPRLDVTSTGVVVGKIKADRLTSRGQLSGNIDAGDLTLSGTVGSNTVIRAKNLEVKLSPSAGRMQVTFGECTLDVGDEPTKSVSADASKFGDTSSSLDSNSSAGAPIGKPLLDLGPDPKPLASSLSAGGSVPPPVVVGEDKNGKSGQTTSASKPPAADASGKGSDKGGKGKGAKGGASAN